MNIAPVGLFINNKSVYTQRNLKAPELPAQGVAFRGSIGSDEIAAEYIERLVAIVDKKPSQQDLLKQMYGIELPPGVALPEQQYPGISNNQEENISEESEDEKNKKALEKKEKIAKFSDDLKGESKEVKDKFAVFYLPSDTPFSLAADGDIELAREIFEIVKEADKDTKNDFILANGKSLTSMPFYVAAIKKDNKLAGEILELVKTLEPSVQREFFNSKTGSNTSTDDDDDDDLSMASMMADAMSMFNKKYTMHEALMQEKCVLMASKFKAAKEEFEKNNQEVVKDEKPLVKSGADERNENQRFRIHKEVKTRFGDIGGMFNVKHQIENELLSILKNPNVKNTDKPGGVMLYGGPGTGKTLLATAIAGEAGVPFISTNGASFNELYVGAGALHVRQLYNKARALAEEHPSKTAIVFIDEVDALAAKRGDSNNSERDGTLNQVLSELDGINSKEDDDIKVITICATNRKDMLDDAFMRSGRIDLEFQIDDPSQSVKARREILEVHAKDKPFESDKIKGEILDKLAQTTSGFSGSDLADVIKRAYRKTLYTDRKTPYITQKDITQAKLEALVGVKNDYENSLDETRLVLAHEGGHAINLLIMNDVFKDEKNPSKMPTQKLDFIVNESRGNAGGLTFSKPSDKNKNLTVESLLSNLAVTYGGYSMEEEMLEGHGAGVSSDLEKNTKLIFDSITLYGLGSKTKFIGCSPNGHTYELFKSDIKADIERYSTGAMDISKQISEFTKPFIERYVEIFSAAQDDKDKIVSGEVFEKMFKGWLEENGNSEKYEELCAKIKENIEDFKKNLY